MFLNLVAKKEPEWMQNFENVDTDKNGNKGRYEVFF